ncbi:MAG: hypothetical protein CSA64_01015 [Arachnia propionica]|nr:MAG: hypothetical protein CSA64_01015 [Arachnia propionica]
MAVKFDDVSFAYQVASLAAAEAEYGAPILSDFQHVFEPGTLTLIVGPSGSGKSTALRLINGLIPHINSGKVNGKVTVAGLDVATSELAELGQRTATVFQNPRNQFFAATVGEELAFARQQAGEPREEIMARVQQVAERIGLAGWLHRSLHQLSGGELQRVACGTMLTSPADIFLFDEPTSNLSGEAVEDIAEIIRQMKADGATIIVAEHRLYFLRDLVDTVITVDKGRISRVWPAQEFYALSDQRRRELGLRILTPPQLSPTHQQSASDADEGLELRNVRFSYGSRRILDIDRLSFPAGQVTALLGANGIGKTTLCRVITGLAQAERGGTISWRGKPQSAKQRLAMSSLVMQDVHRQLFAASVREEVTTGTKSRSDVDVAQILAQLDLSEHAEDHPMSLSGGQKQRLVIASAVADKANVVIFDEPTSGVDYRHLTQITERVREVAAGGAAVIVVSHDLEFVNECADRVVWLTATDGEPAAATSAGGKEPA